MSKNNIRKLKCVSKCNKENSYGIEPITLYSFKGDKKCATNALQNINEFDFLIPCDKDIKKEDIIKSMLYPSINITSKDIIEIYNLNDIDSLKIWIDENISKDFETINRVLNSWIIHNLSNLKYFNNALIDLIEKILKEHFKDIKKNIIDKELSKFVDYWVKKVDIENFDLNLIIDFKNYLNKKYNE